MCLRSYGINFGLYHADEPIVVNHALAYGTHDLNPHFFKIPPLASYILFFVYTAFFLCGKVTGIFSGLGAFQALFIRDPHLFYVVARIFLGVIPGVLAVMALYVWTKEHYLERRALLAALFLAVNFLHVRDSHYAYVDGLMVLGVVLSAGSFLWILKRGERRDYVLSGLWIGAATAAKYNAAILFSGMLAAHFLKSERHWQKLVLGSVCALGVYALFNPYSFVDFDYFKREILTQSGAEAAVGFAHHFYFSILGSAGWGLVFLAACGIFKMIQEDAKKSLAILSFPFLFYGTISLFSQHHERYALPLIPFICLAAATGVDALWNWTGTWAKLPRLFLGAIFFGSALFFPLFKDIQTNRLFNRQDTTAQMSQWIEKNIPPESKIAFDDSFYRPALLRSIKQSEGVSRDTSSGALEVQKKLKNKLQMKYQDPGHPAYFLYFLSENPSSMFSSVWPILPFRWSSLRAKDVQYIVLHYGAEPKHMGFYTDLRRRLKLLQRFSPYADSSKNYSSDKISVTCAAYSWEEIFSRRSFGPVLEIYALETV